MTSAPGAARPRPQGAPFAKATGLAAATRCSQELKCFGVDEARQSVAAVGVLRGTHTGPGARSNTGKYFEADYVYHPQFDGDHISHMTRIWNGAHSLQQL